MAITPQAQQSDGTWAVRNAFASENRDVVAGTMKAADLEALARKKMAQWQTTYHDGKALRVHNSDNDPKPSSRRRSHAEQDYQAINVTKPDDLAETWAVVYLPTNENISHHEAAWQATAAIQRYRAADAKRRVV